MSSVAAPTSRTATQTVYITRTDCRMCGSDKLDQIWSFGETPLANNYLASASDKDPKAPLTVYKCDDCHLVQLRDVVDPNVLFGNYLYVSSTSATFVRHFEEYAQRLIERFKLGKDDLVVDVGSNDGVLLKPLKAAGVKVLGIDPAENIAKEATAQGIETWAEFFTPEIAKRIVAKKGKVKVVSANNVFAHTDGVEVFVEAVKELLPDDGVFVFEVQYLGDLLQKNLFDIVYHEHVCYYHIHPLVQFFQKHGLEVFDVERPEVHGGSIRVYVTPSSSPLSQLRPRASLGEVKGRSLVLQKLLVEEKAAGLNTMKPYEDFAARIEENKQKLLKMLSELKAAGKHIVGYGAPAKATTLCYAFGIDGELLDYIVDDAPLKQGRLMPGTHIPIEGPGVLYGEKPHFASNFAKATLDKKASAPKPDYCVILAWNFAEPIMKNHARFAQEGGKFIIPIPSPTII